MEYTENLNLKKPGQDDFYNVEDFNENAEIIDSALAGKAELANVQRVIRVSIPLSGWSSSAPYSQTVSVAGITESDTPVITPNITIDTTAEQEKIIKKRFSCISMATTGTGTISLVCKGKKPDGDFSINVKGV